MRHVVLAAGYMADKVQHEIGGQWSSMRISYSIEASPLGTGGGVRQACGLLHGSSAHVLNGDTFLRYQPAALADVVNKTGAEIGVALAPVPDVARYGAVECVGERIVGFREKGQGGAGYINAGCYYLTASAIASLPTDTSYSFEEAVLAPMIAAGRVCGLLDTSDFIDIGVPEDYSRAQTLFSAT
ncbi:nucleotidyltransferase family protein [Lysobacter rhizosphaerae]